MEKAFGSRRFFLREFFFAWAVAWGSGLVGGNWRDVARGVAGIADSQPEPGAKSDAWAISFAARET